MPRCTNCGREMPWGVRACPYCHTLHCLGCGQSLPPGVGTCPICGRATRPSLEGAGVRTGELATLLLTLYILGMFIPLVLLIVWISVMAASFIVGPILMRREYPGPWPRVTLTLVLLNTIFFALASLMGIAEEFGLRPTSIMRGEGLHTLLTSFFMHASVTHLLGNMLILLIIGFVIERKMGGPKFLLFYLMVGLVVSVADLAMRPESSIPSVGASGAIAGLFGACLIGATDARAPLFFLFFMLSPTLIFLRLLGFAFLLLAVFFSMLLFIMVILALFDPRYRKTWYLIPFLSVWVLSQVLLGAVGMFAMGVHYWAHAVGIGVGLSGWLLMKREKIRVFPVEGVPPIR